jgi:putative toxin-antitoxin system antitoxin component (TIGR02293 family)
MPLHSVHVAEETSMAAIEARANERADALIGLDKRDRRAAIDATRRGLPIEGLDRLVQTGRLTSAELDRVVLPRKTLSHRRKIGSLTPEQSDRLVRVVRVISAAEETFGSQEKAARWLRRPTVALDGEAPLDLLDTSEGSRAVETLLGRIDHGLGA